MKEFSESFSMVEAIVVINIADSFDAKNQNTLLKTVWKKEEKTNQAQHMFTPIWVSFFFSFFTESATFVYKLQCPSVHKAQLFLMAYDSVPDRGKKIGAQKESFTCFS